DELGMVFAEDETGADGDGDLIERILDTFHVGIDLLAQRAHDSIRGRQEQFALAWEIAVERALAYPELVRQELRVGIGVAVLREQLGGHRQNLLTAAFAKLVILGPSRPFFRSEFHDRESSA